MSGSRGLAHHPSFVLERARDIGAYIRAKRLHIGLTQPELAEFCQLDTTSISRVESGTTNYSISTLIMLCELLGIDICFKDLSKNESEKQKPNNFEDDRIPMMQEQINILSETVKELVRNAAKN